MTDLVADVRVKEQSHAAGAQIAVAVLITLSRVDLWVRVEIAHPLDIDNDDLVARSFEREVTERLSKQVR